MNIKIIGCGGIGSRLVPVLSQYLNYSKYKDVQITLIDGDTFEDRNKERQVFSMLGNKAKVLTDELSRKYPKIFFKHKDQYVNEINVAYYITENDIVFLCVDNHATRKLVSNRCCDIPTVLLISGGNDYHDGNVQVHLRIKGENITKPIANEYHPEIVNPPDKNPAMMNTQDKIDCLEDAKTHPQLLFANNSIAAAMCSAFYAWEQNKMSYDEVFVDVLTGSNRPVKRS